MATREIHKNDVGTLFKITIKNEDNEVVDISSATVKKIILRSSIGIAKEFTADFLTDGTDGIITYITIDGNLNVIGEWQMQAFVTISSGSWNSDITNFTVYDNLV